MYYADKTSDLSNEEISLIETQKQMDKPEYAYKEIDGTYDDYMELMIQFSYVMIFGTAFPLAPLLAFLNNLIELKIDKWKVLFLTRRPQPISVSNIGVWKIFLNAMIYASIVSNLSLLFISADFVEKDST